MLESQTEANKKPSLSRKHEEKAQAPVVAVAGTEKQRLEDAWRAEDNYRRERDSLNAQVKALAEEIRKLKSLREEANKKVAELKKLRDAKHEEFRPAAEELKKLEAGLENVLEGTGRKSAAELRRLLEKMEFDYQTKPLPFSEEKKLVKSIEELKKSLKARSGAELKLGAFSALRRAISRIRRESDEVHLQLVAEAKASQEAHEKIISLQKKIEGLRKLADDRHEKVLESRAAVLVLHEKKLAGIRAVREEATRKANERKQRLMTEVERAALEVEKKIGKELADTNKKKKKFDMRDLQLLQTTGKKIPF